MPQRMKGIKFTFYVDFDKRFKKAKHILSFRISQEIQEHLKIKAGDKIAIIHDFNNEFILYLKNMKNITHQEGYVAKPIDLTNKNHRKRQIKLALTLRKGWVSFESIPEWAKTSSNAKYILLKKNTVLIDLGIK